jgi:hypothetical protein
MGAPARAEQVPGREGRDGRLGQGGPGGVAEPEVRIPGDASAGEFRPDHADDPAAAEHGHRADLV